MEAIKDKLKDFEKTMETIKKYAKPIRISHNNCAIWRVEESVNYQPIPYKAQHKLYKPILY